MSTTLFKRHSMFVDSNARVSLECSDDELLHVRQFLKQYIKAVQNCTEASLPAPGTSQEIIVGQHHSMLILKTVYNGVTTNHPVFLRYSILVDNSVITDGASCNTKATPITASLLVRDLESDRITLDFTRLYLQEAPEFAPQSVVSMLIKIELALKGVEKS